MKRILFQGAFFYCQILLRRNNNMMDYESFKQRVMDEFLSYMPERYSDWKRELRKAPEVN